METADVNKDKLVADMRVVIADAEELLRATATGWREGCCRSRKDPGEQIASSWCSCTPGKHCSRSWTGAMAAARYVHRHPQWLIAAAVVCCPAFRGELPLPACATSCRLAGIPRGLGMASRGRRPVRSRGATDHLTAQLLHEVQATIASSRNMPLSRHNHGTYRK
jgi:hypothetical protein